MEHQIIRVWVIVLMTALSVFGQEGMAAPHACRNRQSYSQYLVVNGTDVTESEFRRISELFGDNQGNISVGVGVILSYLNVSHAHIAMRLNRYFDLSMKYNVPIVIQMDGEQWWDGRPDLWNWWDRNGPGYDPHNKHNVEWTDWNPESAVKIGWRNWGRQLRVRPMPNLMSQEYRVACYDEMNKLIPIIMDWYNRLSGDQKKLFIGLKLGWESSIGVNNWYYPDGNALLNQPEDNDPNYGLDTDRLPGRGVTTIGYAAVSTAGIASSGPMTQEHQTEVVRRYLEDFCKFAYELGVPRTHLFTHGGGWSEGETLYTAAVNAYSCPGWSFYNHALDVKKDKAAMNALGHSDAPYWGAVEFLYMGQNTESKWYRALKNAFDTDRLRYVNIYNWGGIKNNAHAISAIKTLIAE